MNFSAIEQSVLNHAHQILESRIKEQDSHYFTNPDLVKDFVTLHFAKFEREVFSVLFLNSQHRLIKIEDMFFGSIDTASVYPREVVKRALELNSAAVIFSHNHPSGVGEPSHSDEKITKRLVEALLLMNIRVLDHLVVGDSVVSFAERGLISSD